jgi:hypothetical protein
MLLITEAKMDVAAVDLPIVVTVSMDSAGKIDAVLTVTGVAMTVTYVRMMVLAGKIAAAMMVEDKATMMVDNAGKTDAHNSVVTMVAMSAAVMMEDISVIVMDMATLLLPLLMSHVRYV